MEDWQFTQVVVTGINIRHGTLAEPASVNSCPHSSSLLPNLVEFRSLCCVCASRGNSVNPEEKATSAIAKNLILNRDMVRYSCRVEACLSQRWRCASESDNCDLDPINIRTITSIEANFISQFDAAFFGIKWLKLLATRNNWAEDAPLPWSTLFREKRIYWSASLWAGKEEAMAEKGVYIHLYGKKK